MKADLLAEAVSLKQRGETFALATVVRSQRPASARPGAKALIYADGRLDGWVGGSCARPVVVREALRAMALGTPRLLRLRGRGGPANDDENLVEYPMTCHSGGSLEIYVEPHLPAPRLVVVGDAPVAQALVSLASFLGYDVTAVAPDATDQDFPDARRVVQQFDGLGPELDARSYLVLASVGDYDEQALEQAASADPPYIAVVASPRRAATLRVYLRDRGVPEATVAKIRAPAGLDIGAVEPEEIALSIMAEIVELRRRSAPGSPAPQAGPETAVDPICGMSVEIAGARHIAEFGSEKVYFCCPACQRRFVQERAESR
jgi:xanthine dehydrogenase accessory factor